MNSLLNEYRSKYDDPRSDAEVLAGFIERHRGFVEKNHPDAIADFEKLSQPQPALALAPAEPEPIGFGEEFTRGLKRGTKGAGSAWAGAGSLAARVVGADDISSSLGKTSLALGDDAGKLAGTVPSYKDIHGVSDTARYVVGGAGEVIPSLVEAAAFALIGTAVGAAAGTAVEPGGGTVVGGAGGAVTGFIAKGAVKRLLKKELIKNAAKMEATDLGIATAARMAGESAAKMTAEQAAKILVREEGKNLAMTYGAGAAGFLNSLAMNSGDIYQNMLSQGIDPDKAVNASLLGGLVSAVPDSVLPSYIAGKILNNQIKGAVTEATKKGFFGYVTRFASEAAKTIPWEGGTEGFQEWVGILAERYAKGEQPMFSELSEKDKERVINATALGAIGGLIAAPVAAIPSKGGDRNGRQETKEEGQEGRQERREAEGEARAVLTTAAPPRPGQDISDVVEQYRLTPQEIEAARRRRASLEAAYPELAAPPPPPTSSGPKAYALTEKDITDLADQLATPWGIHWDNEAEFMAGTKASRPEIQQAESLADIGLAGKAIAENYRRAVYDGLSAGKAVDNSLAVQVAQAAFARGYNTPEEVSAAMDWTVDKSAEEITQQFHESFPSKISASTAESKQPLTTPTPAPAVEVAPPAPPAAPPAAENQRREILRQAATLMPEDRPEAPREIQVRTPKGIRLASVRGELDRVTGKLKLKRFKIRDPLTGSYQDIWNPGGGREFDSWAELEEAGLGFLRTQFEEVGQFSSPTPAVEVEPTAQKALQSNYESGPRVRKSDQGDVSENTPIGVAGSEYKQNAISKTQAAKASATLTPEEGRAASGATVIPEPEVAQSAVTPATSPPQAKAIFTAEELVSMADFERSALAGQESGAGKTAAEAFEETDDTGRLMTDATATAEEGKTINKARSRKLGVFLAPDQSHYVVATAYDVTAPKVTTESGGQAIKKFLKRGYKLVASVKTTEPTKGFYQRLSPEQWGQAQATLNAQRQQVLSTLAPAPEEVTTETPADVAIAAEGFTPDEATAIWKAIKGIRPDDVKIQMPILAKDLDVRHAIGKIFDLFEKAGLDSPDAADRTMAYVQDAAKFARGSQTQFINTLVTEVGRFAGEGSQEPAQEAQAAAAAAKPVGEREGGAAEEGGRRTGSRAKPDTQRQAEGIRHRSSETQPGWRVSDHETRRRFEAALEGLDASGLSVTQMRQVINGMVADAGGIYSPEGRAIVLYVADAVNPTRGNYISLLHEAADAVSESETPERQAMLHRAVSSLTDGQLGIEGWAPKLDEALSASEAQVVTSLERLSEAVARKLEAQGFNAAEARGFWQAVVRWLQDIWNRVALALQVSRFGEGHVNPETAEAYFTNRLISLLAGGQGNFSFISWLGGPKLTGGQTAELYTKTGGIDQLPELFDPETGKMVYAEALENSTEAVAYNHLRFREPSYVSEAVSDVGREPDINETANAAVKIAAQNEIRAKMKAVYDEWNLKGGNSGNLTFEQWWASGLFTQLAHPDAMITAQNERLTAANNPANPPANPETTMSELPPVMQPRAANTAYKNLLQERSWREQRAKENGFELTQATGRDGKLINPRNLNHQLERNALRLRNITSKFEDVDYIASETFSIFDEMMDEINRDAKDISQLARKYGVLAQTIEAIEGRMDDGLAKEYIGAINKLYKRWKSNDQASMNFADTLQAAALVEGVDWSTDSPVEIRQALVNAANFTPALAHLKDPSMERRAELSMLIAFGKRHYAVMSVLEMRKQTTAEERAVIKEALSLAMGTSRSASAEARMAVTKLTKAETLANRLLNAVERVKAENRALRDGIVRKETFVEFEHNTEAALRNGLDDLGRVIGAQSEDWEAYHNATLPVPDNPNQPPDQWPEKTLLFKENGTTQPEVVDWIRRMDAHLSTTPKERWSVAQRTLAVQKQKLEQVLGKLTFDPIRANIVTRLVGSITDKLDSTGHPAAKLAAVMIRRIDASSAYGKSAYETGGGKWSKAEGDAMREAKRILGREPDVETFRDLMWNPALKYFENRADLLVSMPTDQAKQAALTAARNYFSGSETTKRLVEDDRFWRAFERYIDHAEANSNFLNSAAKAMGRKIEDMGYYRDPIGKAPFTMMRRFRRTTEKLWQEMRENWDGTKGRKLNGPWVADAYTEDAEALRADVKSRLTPPLWDKFVRELVEEPGRSQFYSPVAGDVKPLALRENMVKAFQASEVGDLVGLAEKLYELESQGLAGQPLVDLPDFVAETLSTFQNFYGILHGEFAEHANSNQKGVPRPNRILMNARVSESAPAGWLEYLPLDAQSMRLAVRSMAFQFGGGRDLEAIRTNFQSAHNELSLLDQEFNALRRKLKTQGKTGKALREALIQQAEATGGRGHLSRMENAGRNARLVDSMSNSFDGMVRAQLDIPMELRTWIQLIGSIAGATVQGPGTALQDLSYLFIQPFRNLGLNKEAAGLVAGHVKTVAEGIAGTMGWGLRQQLNFDAEDNQRYHELGYDESDASLTVFDKFNELTHEQMYLTDPDGRSLPSRAWLGFERGVNLAGRGVRSALGTGIGRGDKDRFAYPTPKPFAPFTMSSQFQHLATIKGMWKFVRPRVVRAIQFMEHDDAALDDPMFRFKAKDLGMSETAYRYIADRMADHGMSFEGLARDAITRRVNDPTAPPLLPEHYRSLAALATTETVMEAGLTTRMPGFITNPVLAASAPLIGWAFQATNQLSKRGLDPILQAQGTQATARAVWSSLLPYAAILPIGIGFALWREWFDEHLAGKKANVQGFGQNNTFLAVLEKAGRSSVFGIAGDAANSLLNSDTNRPFSVDSRVLFLSSIFGLGRATTSWVRQGSFDYANVGRPYITALGGSGFLQQLDVINHALTSAGAPPLVEAEARVVSRGSVRNWLSSGGRALGMDVRTGTFGQAQSLPNPAKPFIGQMLLAAYANDPQDFAEARVKAIVTRMREERVDRDKAEDYVKRAYQGMHPLSTVFRTKPSEAEFGRLVASLPEHGRIAVMTALRNYNHYGATLGITPSLGRQEERSPLAALRQPGYRVPTYEQIRRQAMAGAR